MYAQHTSMEMCEMQHNILSYQVSSFFFFYATFFVLLFSIHLSSECWTWQNRKGKQLSNSYITMKYV